MNLLLLVLQIEINCKSSSQNMKNHHMGIVCKLNTNTLAGILIPWNQGVGRGLVIFKNKKNNVRTRLFGNLEYTKHGDTDGVGIQFFYWLWLSDLKPEAWSLCSSNLLGFFNQGAPKRHRKVPTINAQSLSKEAKQNSIKRKLFGLPSRYLHCSDGHLQDHTSQDHFCSVINEFPVWNSKSFKPRWWDTVPHPEREADLKIPVVFIIDDRSLFKYKLFARSSQ